MNPPGERNQFENVGEAPLLPDELLRHVSPEKLEENAAQYPELQRGLSEKQQKQVEVIKGVLLKLPLIHATREPFDVENNILPNSDLPDQSAGNTYGLDRSLGLDKYTFFHWGLPEKSRYGKNFLLLSSELLFSPNTIVTPRDIGTIAYVDNTPFDELETDTQKAYQEGFFDQMVTGRKWFEIIARRVLASYEAGNKLFALTHSAALGEIKHLGQVDHSLIERQITSGDFNEYYKFMYETGFAFTNMEDKRGIFLRTGKNMGVDPLPEECGIDYEQAAKHWETILANI